VPELLRVLLVLELLLLLLLVVVGLLPSASRACNAAAIATFSRVCLACSAIAASRASMLTRHVVRALSRSAAASPAGMGFPLMPASRPAYPAFIYMGECVCG